MMIKFKGVYFIYVHTYLDSTIQKSGSNLHECRINIKNVNRCFLHTILIWIQTYNQHLGRDAFDHFAVTFSSSHTSWADRNLSTLDFFRCFIEWAMDSFGARGRFFKSLMSAVPDVVAANSAASPACEVDEWIIEFWTLAVRQAESESDISRFLAARGTSSKGYTVASQAQDITYRQYYNLKWKFILAPVCYYELWLERTTLRTLFWRLVKQQ